MGEVLCGKSIFLRNVERGDAEFILSLRLDPDKSTHLNKTENNLIKQEKYIERYKTLEDEWYFIIKSADKNENLGTVRIYDLRKDEKSFCWGSWLIKDGADILCAIESAVLIYDFGFYYLNNIQSHFDVRKKNDKVIAFHKRCGAKIFSEDEENFYFKYSLADYEKFRSKLPFGRFDKKFMRWDSND